MFNIIGRIGGCRKGELPLNETRYCQLNGYTCTIYDGPACCQGRSEETRPCVPCDETKLRKTDVLQYTTEGTCYASGLKCL